MTYRTWWDVRRFLFDERFGPLMREAEREAAAKAQAEQVAAEAKSAAYLKSVALLKAQGSSDGSG